MAILTCIDLVEYEKKLERQQETLNVSDMFTAEDLKAVNESFDELRNICKKRIAVLCEVNEADQL